MPWIWENPAWPAFRYDEAALRPVLRDCVAASGRLGGMTAAISADQQARDALDAQLQNIITSSAIEGERLNEDAVRSSLAKRLGVAAPERRPTARAEGLAGLQVDATEHYNAPMTMDRLFQWHRLLFPDDPHAVLPQHVRPGELRGDEPMQVVSGPIGRQRVHFEAPPRDRVDAELTSFLDWFAQSRGSRDLDPFVRAGITHLWFVTIHPFEDGNGRLTRALTDLALAQAEHQAVRFHAMSASILADREGYYRMLEATQRADMDVTRWLQWFLTTLLASYQAAFARIDRVLHKARFWHTFKHQDFNEQQLKVLNKMLDSDGQDFPHVIGVRQYMGASGASKPTATRHLADLVEKGALIKLPGVGKATRYQLGDMSPPESQPE